MASVSGRARFSRRKEAAGVIALLLAACRPQGTTPLAMQVRVLPVPAKVGPARVLISVFDASKVAVTDARVSVEADMSHPGMKPLFADAHRVDRNTYEARIDFTMPGDWVLLIEATRPGGRQTIKEQRLTVVEK